MNFFLKKTNNISKAFLIGLILIVASVGTPLSAFAKPVQVAVVPFKINAEKDLSYLRDGIVDMLSSRLSWADKVMVINNQETEKALKTVIGPLNEIKAREMGAKLDADYVLFGSLTVIGNSVSIDAKMVDVSGEKETLSFFNQSQGMDQVIPSINLFASDINEKEFGRVMETRRVAPSTGPSSTRTGQAQEDVRAHPDKLIAGGIAGGELQGGQKAAPDSAFILTQSSNSQSAQFWKSRNFKFLINGIAMGDVDNDGKIETVVVLDNNVFIYRTINNKLVKIKEIAKARNDHYIGVDIGDINNNGTPEIFITSLNALRNQANSFVLEYDGEKYKTIIDRTRWYYRVIQLSGHDPVLFGQKHKTDTDDVFGPAIFKFVWENSDYIPLQQILPKHRANVLGVAYGDIMDTGDPVVVAYNSSDRFQIVDSQGEVRWKGAEHYGGSTLYFTPPKTDPGSGESRKYYPMRLQLTDLDDDGKYEVVAAKNHEIAGNMLDQFRYYTNAHFELLSWDGLGLASKWKTRKISGHIRDFAIGDFDNDGQIELVAVVIIKEGAAVWAKPKSAIIAYDLKSK